MTTDSLRLAVEREKCEKDHLFFTRRFFMPRMGFKFSVNWHHVYIAWIIDEVIAGRIANVVINVPPGAGKTELMTNLIPRGIALNPRSRFLYLSFSQSLVDDVSATARNIVKSSEFQALWQVDIATDTDSKANWKTNVDGFNAGHVYAASMGGQVTGRRAGTLDDGFTGAIILDDPLKPEDAFSFTARDKANRKLLNTVNSRKAKSNTPIIVIMQRLHEDDPTGFIMDGNMPSQWTLVSIPALIDDNYIAELPEHIRVLIPTDSDKDDQGRFSYWQQKESLLSLLELEKGGSDKSGQQVSRYTFASQYMQSPIVMGGDIIKSANFLRWSVIPDLQYRVIYADTAQKTGERNDYSVFQCWGMGNDNHIYLLDQIRGKWEAPELRRQAIDFWHKHLGAFDIHGSRLIKMRVEDKASGTGLIQDIQASGGIPVEGIERNKDKLTRVMDVVSYIEAKLVHIPEYAPWVSDFTRECDSFTADDTHTHDDQIDPMCDAISDMLGQVRDMSIWSKL